MNKYAKIVDEKISICEVGLGTNTDFYQSIGMSIMDVTLSELDNNWYLTEKYPQAPIYDDGSPLKLYYKIYTVEEEIEVPDYDPETGEQTGTHTEIITKEVADLVIAPENYFICYKDNYTYGSINPGYFDEALARVKSAKIAGNDLARDNALIAGVTYRDVLFDSDTDQKINLLAIVTTMDDENVITWFGMENVPLECTKEDLINIGALITQLHSFCWNKNAQIKSLIANASTIEEVNAIEIDYTLPEVEE